MFPGMDDDNRQTHFWDDDQQQVEDWLNGRGATVMAIFVGLLVLGFIFTLAQDLL